MDTMTSPQAPAAIASFRMQTARAVEELSGPDAVDTIANLHDQELRAAAARGFAAVDEAAHATAEAMRQHYLLAGVLETAQRETLRAGHQYARAELVVRLLNQIGKLAAAAEEGDGKLDVDDVRAILATKMAPIPFRPSILAFHPSQQYTAGHFVTPDEAVHQVWPFAGWAYVLESPDRPARLVPCFLVEHEVRTEAALTQERGLELKKLV